jgi:hypothetical protein
MPMSNITEGKGIVEQRRNARHVNLENKSKTVRTLAVSPSSHNPMNLRVLDSCPIWIRIPGCRCALLFPKYPRLVSAAMPVALGCTT